MRNRKLTATGDYSWGNSEQDFYINVPAAVGQAVQTRLLLFQGEWFLDNTVGLPLIGGVIGKVPQSTADAAVQNRTTGTQGLADISSYSSEIDTATRAYSVQMTINTIYGPLDVPLSINLVPPGFSTLDTESEKYLETESSQAIIL